MEPVIHMDSILYNAAISGNIEVLSQNEEKIGVQVTPDKKTVLHLASQLGQTEAVKLIISIQPSLITQANLYGETALHLATRDGHANVVQVLIDCARKLDDEDIESRPHAWQFILWMANVDGETVLHEAVRYSRPEVLSMLLKEDPSYLHSANKKGETPLYIAANRDFVELIDVILKNCEAPAYGGPNGTTALHGAVDCGSEECTRKLLEWKKSIAMETDSNGETPLHYAAHYGNLNIACQLLCADTSIACIIDKEYSALALHLAAANGHVSIMREILLRCPDTCGVVDKFGQNIIHLGIKNNQKEVVEYIIEECPVISSLINQKDVDGNTPSHLMALADCYFPQLIQHEMVDKGALNNPSAKIEAALKSYGDALRVHKTENISKVVNEDVSRYPDCNERIRGPDTYNEWAAKYVNNHIIVATLIVTVTFAAGFTMPGGYIESGSKNQGMAILTSSIAFQVFIISDTLALLISITALLLLMYTATAVEEDLIVRMTAAGGVLTTLSLLAMMIAFVAGMYAVLAHSSALAIATCLLGSTFFPIYIFVTLSAIKSAYGSYFGGIKDMYDMIF